MRYRFASTVPGGNFPSSIALDERGCDARDMLEAGEGAEACAGPDDCTVRVATSSAAKETPHPEQKRLLSDISDPQDGQVVIGSSCLL